MTVDGELMTVPAETEDGARAFALLVPGPLLGAIAMLRLRSLPEASLIAQGPG
jgi:hypothetical protein